MIKSKIHYCYPSITQLEKEYAYDAAQNGWGENCYKYIDKFESNFKNYLGVDYAIATSSCTGAIQMGLHALDIKEGDEIILADTNWVATLAPIIHLGATPVFVDILEDSWCLDPQLVEKSITSKTKAIIAVHLYGNLCNMKELLKIGKKYNIPVVEDSAEALGTVYNSKKAGSIGLFGTFSFHGTKTITTGEGGMFVTNDKALYDRVLTLSNHGRHKNESKQFWPAEIGYKYKISNIQAALGCAQVERIQELIDRKRHILNAYKDKFKNIKCIKMNPEPIGTINGAWMSNIVFSKDTSITAEILFESFQKENIDARMFFSPLSSTPPMSKYKESGKSNINSFSIASRSINLPCYHDMSEQDINRVTDVIFNILNKYDCS